MEEGEWFRNPSLLGSRKEEAGEKPQEVILTESHMEKAF